MGGEVRQYRVAPQPSALARARRQLRADRDRRCAQFGTNTGGGFTDQHAREYLIRNIGRTTSLEDLRNIVVATIEGRPILLRQVASVEFAPKVKRGDGGYMGKPAVIVSVEKQPNVDTVQLTQRDRAGARASSSPACRTASRPTRSSSGRRTSSRPRSATCSAVLLEAALVVAVVLFAFLLNWRTTAISLTAIPVSILTTAIIFKLLGLSINTMTLGGLAIAIGELVDDAVVDVENIFRRLRENREQGNPRSVFDVVVSASQGSALRHRLRHDDHRAGVRAAVCAFRHRGPAVRAARPGLHHLDPREPRGVDHADAGDGLLHAAGPEAPRRSARAGWCACSSGQPRGARTSPSPTGDCCSASRRWPCSAPALAPSACRARSCRPSTKAPSPSTSRSIPAFRLPKSNRVGSIAERLMLEVPEVTASGGAPAAPNSTSMPKASIRPTSKST